MAVQVVVLLEEVDVEQQDGQRVGLPPLLKKYGVRAVCTVVSWISLMNSGASRWVPGMGGGSSVSVVVLLACRFSLRHRNMLARSLESCVSTLTAGCA
jgi:hypothetical protein